MMPQPRDQVYQLSPSVRQRLDTALTGLLRAYTLACSEMRPQDAHRFIHRVADLMTQVEDAAGLPSGRISKTSEWRATMLRTVLGNLNRLDADLR
jgi:hypothetical protein